MLPFPIGNLMGKGYRRGILSGSSSSKAAGPPANNVPCLLAYLLDRILWVRKSQDCWEMVTVPEMTMESVLILRGCIRQCLSSEPQCPCQTPLAGVHRVILSACWQSCYRFRLVWMHDKTDNFLKLFLSVKNEIAFPLLSDSTLIQLRNKARLYWCKGTCFALCMNCSCATNQ